MEYARPLCPADAMLSRGFRKNLLIVEYRKALREARWAARIVGLLHSFSTFLAWCNLTWASVVVLGANFSNLRSADYYFVTALLLLEAARLASATFFAEILTRSPEPGHLNHSAFCTIDVYRYPLGTRLLPPLFQALLIAASFIGAIIRLLNTRFYDPVDHLQISLRIFYVLVIANAAVSSLYLFSSFMAWIRLYDPCELSILWYYDEVLQNVLVNGVIQADNFNFFQYAFKILGREHARFNSWERVVMGHKKLLTYIYAHKQGVDYLQIYLDSEDASIRQAAVDTVGMWADEKWLGLKTELLELPPELLTKLADMVGITGEVGWAATNSFGALAKRNPQYLVQTLTSSKEPVLHRIAQQVNESSTRSLASVRTLVLFYNQIFLRRKAREMVPTATNTMDAETTTAVVAAAENTTERALPEHIDAELEGKLKHLLKWSNVQRLRVQSAYLLYLLGKLDAPCYHLVSSIMPASDDYWYSFEQKMLEFLLEFIGAERPAAVVTLGSDQSYPSPFEELSSFDTYDLAELSSFETYEFACYQSSSPFYPSHVWLDHEAIYEGD